PTSYPVPTKVNATIRARRPDVEKALKVKKVALVDVRSKPEFVGEIIAPPGMTETRSEEHTSELQSRGHLVCRLLLEKKKDAGRERNGGHRQCRHDHTVWRCAAGPSRHTRRADQRLQRIHRAPDGARRGEQRRRHTTY